MKLMKLLFTLLFVVAFATVGFGQNMEGTAHDFRLASGWNTNGEYCKICHTPHSYNTAASPLWNRDLTLTTFTPYPTGGTMQSTPGAPAGTSLMCLSCHDGVAGLEDFGGAGGTTNQVSNAFSNDLGNDHPISMTYDDALATADGFLHTPSTDLGIGGTIQSTMLFGDKVECASCHDVHNGADVAKLLRVDNTGSALCLKCHNK